MVSPFDPVAAKRYPSASQQRAAPWDFWRPLSPPDSSSPEAVEDRIRWVFHLGAADRLPPVHLDALRVYRAHLARFLSFPFPASHCEETEPLVFDNAVVVTGLSDLVHHPLDATKGILCEVIHRSTARLPLGLLKVDAGDPNCQMIEDYWHWFWNYHSPE